ncbi:hypothetical protein mRhiFer1_010140 [Rhinolophus ferrumequinum]|uniref:Uncharacterized protein n=1 Tax=Rhinolophus ferrumequinum TaxID=59479 RepID=A0A7J7XPJ6_RHIFE|nr:hypothetical protein mRhiFer1_010140 [Rhinolophus ferrumequinum]
MCVQPVTENMGENMHCAQMCVCVCARVCVHVCMRASPGDFFWSSLFGLDLFRLGFSFRQCVQVKLWAPPSCAPDWSRGPSHSHCSGQGSSLLPGKSSGSHAGEAWVGSQEGTWPPPDYISYVNLLCITSLLWASFVLDVSRVPK